MANELDPLDLDDDLDVDLPDDDSDDSDDSPSEPQDRTDETQALKQQLDAMQHQQLQQQRAELEAKRQAELAALETQLHEERWKALETDNAERERAAMSKLIELKLQQRMAPVVEQQSDPYANLAGAAKSWLAKNAWFNQDPVKTAKAKAIAAELEHERKMDPDDPALYAELDRRLNGEQTEKKRVQTGAVAGVSRGNDGRFSRQPGKQARVLSRDDIRAMTKYGFDKNNVQHRRDWLRFKDGNAALA